MLNATDLTKEQSRSLRIGDAVNGQIRPEMRLQCFIEHTARVLIPTPATFDFARKVLESESRGERIYPESFYRTARAYLSCLEPEAQELEHELSNLY